MILVWKKYVLLICRRRIRLQVKISQTFFLFQNYFSFCLSVSDWVATMTWALQSRDFRLGGEAGEEGRRGQWRSTPEAFLLLLKTEQPPRPFWKTSWMSLIQIQLPYSFNTDGIEVDVVFSTRFLTFLARANRISDHNQFIHGCR